VKRFALAFAAIMAAASAAGEDDDLGILGNKRTVVAEFVKQKGMHKGGESSTFDCTALSGGANTNLDCDGPFPNNEPDIEVDPANPLHMVASSNDYDLFVLNAAGTSLLGFSAAVQSGTQDPYELATKSAGFPAGSRVVVVEYYPPRTVVVTPM